MDISCDSKYPPTTLFSHQYSRPVEGEGLQPARLLPSPCEPLGVIIVENKAAQSCVYYSLHFFIVRSYCFVRGVRNMTREFHLKTL